ncbi:hypothetical protein [Candidatus Thiodictyon syntrophicum]|jgi:hypothetical protein|uniref:CHAT domain-containing protein n=1 Tax=Candidatus Thiodictyon syntrophicum TaxID=1166950 RepID=A0A2K8UB19_9GAMM|nr:hypothetical protein [Candidatus Thiodictyon syntrophicum]AUB82755.1 hypothetical protein THSYN_18630 [Candidatus Thiodictyon syntrophicum]
MDITVEIRARNGGWTGLVRRSDEPFSRTLGNMRLGSAQLLSLKGVTRSLGDLVRALVDYEPADLALFFDERGQLEIGSWLYREVFGDQRIDADEARLQIDTDDEHITRLPWPLLYRDGVFCCANGWSVALGSGARRAEVRLPPQPRLLLVMPEPGGVSPTQAAAHLDELETLLSAGLPTLRQGRQLQVARTWEAFLTQCRDFRPELVYYYGHGLATGLESTRLVFADAQGRRDDRPVADLAQVLGNLETPPLLAYINCCQGDAGGLLGAGRQLARCIPAVVTNRTVAMIAAARGQALALWDALLLKGESPHRALATLYARRSGPDLSLADARWMTPVLHAGYGTWHSEPPGVRLAADHDPYWHLKIDRVSQYHTVAGEARRMVREGRPRCHAFVWYGRAGEGVDLFHTRLNVQLREDLDSARLLEIAPRWPDDLADPARSFEDMLCEAFGVQGLDEVPARIRQRAEGGYGARVLVYLRHQPVLGKRLIDPGRLRQYLQWLDHRLAGLLDEGQFLLVGISFVVEKPPGFRESVRRQGLLELRLEETVFQLLDELERLAPHHLLTFVQTHRIPHARRLTEKVLGQILVATEGNYDQTVEKLRSLMDRAWTEPEPGPPATAEEEDDY